MDVFEIWAGFPHKRINVLTSSAEAAFKWKWETEENHKKLSSEKMKKNLTQDRKTIFILSFPKNSLYDNLLFYHSKQANIETLRKSL